MKLYYDIECDRILTEEQLRLEYEEYKLDIEVSSGATTYDESIMNATGKNGFLHDLDNVAHLEALMHKLARTMVEFNRYDYPVEHWEASEMWNTIYHKNKPLGNEILERYKLL